jgi:tetratricopeptide (TPR) repeat protein
MPKVERFHNLLTIVVGIASFLAGALASLALANKYVAEHVDQIVTKRLAPYEAITSGISLNQTEDWNEAAVVLQRASAAFKSPKLQPEIVNLYDDTLLYAIVNSDSPEQFSQDFYRISQRIGPKVPEVAWRIHTVGWYYLRTGKLSVAGEKFNQAVQLWDGRQEYRSAAESVYGLLIVALAKGDVDLALRHAGDLVERNPLAYSKQSLAQYARTWDKDKAGAQIKAMYAPTFSKSLDEFARRLETDKAPNTGLNRTDTALSRDPAG